jgi:lipid-binding SYLF domain-containing protein
MNKIIYCLFALFLSSNAIASEASSTVKQFKKSPQVAKFFKSAYGYAVFPTVAKGGIGLGGSYGEGEVFKHGKKTGSTSLTQITIGFQLGGQAFSEIIFFKDKATYDSFTKGNFEFSAQASAVAITVGANAKTSTTGTSAGASAGSENNEQRGFYQNGMATFTLTKGGLMYEAALGGQKFSFDEIKSNNE